MALLKPARPTGFEPVASAFGGQLSNRQVAISLSFPSALLNLESQRSLVCHAGKRTSASGAGAVAEIISMSSMPSAI